MPTFRNNGKRTVFYNGKIQDPNGKTRDVLVFFDAGKEVGLLFWVPYEQLGLELVSADNPSVPNTVLLSGTFNFNKNTERKFTIEHCDRYILYIIIQNGAVKVYPGNSTIAAEVRANVENPFHYKIVYDWEFAPYLRVVGLEDGTKATIHAEVYREGNVVLD